MGKITLAQFGGMAYNAMVDNKMKDSYFYVQFMQWCRHPSDMEGDEKPEYSVCYYTKEGNFSESAQTPELAIESAILKYKHRVPKIYEPVA